MRKCFYGVLVSYVWKPSTSSVQTDRIYFFLDCFLFIKRRLAAIFAVQRQSYLYQRGKLGCRAHASEGKYAHTKFAWETSGRPLASLRDYSSTGKAWRSIFCSLERGTSRLRKGRAVTTSSLMAPRLKAVHLVMLSAQKTHFFPSGRRFFFSLQQLQTIDDQ